MLGLALTLSSDALSILKTVSVVFVVSVSD